MKRIVLVLGVAALLFASCGSSPKANLTGGASYYVRADGNDRNTGTSEDKPFKTMAKAIEAASKTSVKKITVIGVLEGEMTAEDIKKTTAAPVKTLIKNMDATGGQDIAKVIANNIGVAMLAGSYDQPNPREILITGKPNASDAEKAVLTSKKGTPLQFGNISVRLEHIEVSGCQGTAILAVFGDLTLAQGVKITKNSGNNTIYVHSCTLIMRDNAEVSYNEGAHNVGIHLENGSVGIMLDNAVIANNKATGNGGGVALDGSTLIMKNNAAISNNSAGNGGGGIITFTDTENGYFSQIILEDNASVTKNSAKYGGGILLQDKLILRNTARITENTATEAGGGIWGETANASVNKGANVILANNKAPQSPDSNFRFN